MKTNFGDTLLMEAVKRNKTECVKLLLDHVKQNIKDNNGNRPLFSVTSNQDGFVEFLLTHDQLDPNVQNNFGDTALMMAVKFEATECVELLISDKQTEFNLKNTFGDTPLIEAVKRNKTEYVKLLLCVAPNRGGTKS